MSIIKNNTLNILSFFLTPNTSDEVIQFNSIIELCKQAETNEEKLINIQLKIRYIKSLRDMEWQRENTSSYLIAKIDRFVKFAEIEIQNLSKINESSSKEFEEYFSVLPKNVEGLKNYLKTLKGKKLACAIYLLDKKGAEINLDRTRFVRTFNSNVTMQGVNTYFLPNKIVNDLKVIDADKDVEFVNNNIIKYL